MDKRPKISIICRTYNQENFIEKAVNSALNQTLGNFELIIIDDCSTDNTSEIISKITDCRIRYMRNDKNMGPLENFNIGVKLTTGEYIAVLDGDDEYLPQKLEKQAGFLDNNPDYGAVFSYIEVISGKGDLLNSYSAQTIKNLINNPAGTRAEMLKKCFFMYNFLAFPTEMFRKQYAIHFNEHLLSCGDAYFHINTLMQTKIKVIEEPLINYRVLETNESVANWYTEYSHMSEKFFVLDKFLEIKDPELFKEIFKDYLNDFSVVEPALFPYILSRIAGKVATEDKQQWSNYNFHRFISNRENYNLLREKVNLSYKDIVSIKGGVGINEKNIRNKVKKYKKLFKIFLVTSIILLVLLIIHISL